MSGFDWRAWRADVAARLDRRWIGAALAYAAVLTTFILMGDNTGHELAAFIFYTLFGFSTVMLTLAVLAVALVAVARGVSVWGAYTAAGGAIAAIGTVLGIVIETQCGCPPRPLPLMIAGHLWALSHLLPPAVLYVYASSATRDEELLRFLEAERAAEAARLAQQRLHTELATVDHDLVLSALRLALTMRAHDAPRAQALLEAVAGYLRLAQQRGSSEPGRIAAALADLRRACASGGGVSAPQVSA